MPPSTHNGLPSADQVIDDTFLTPRVIDRRAFDDYSAALQDLIREATGRGQTLQTAVGDVKVLGESLREATKELKGRLETAVKVMPTLEQRVTRAEQLLAAASGTRLAEHVEKTIEATVAAKLAELERRVTAIVTTAEQRLSAVDKAIAGKMPYQAAEIEALVKTKVDQAQVQLLLLQEQALGQVQTAQNELQTQVVGVTERLGVLQRQAAESAGALEAGINRHWDEVRARIAQMEKDVVAGTDQARSRAKVELEETIRAVDARRAQIESSAVLMESELKAKVDQARDKIGAMERDILAGIGGVRQKARADLEEMLARVESASKGVAEKTAESQGALRQAREQGVDIEARLERRLELAKAKAEMFLGAIESRADAAVGVSVGVDDRVAKAGAELEDLLTRARERVAVLTRQAEEAAGEAHRRLEQQSAEVVRQVGTAVQEAQGALTPMHETSRALIEQIDERLGRVAWEYQAAVAPHVTRLEKLCDEGARLTGTEGVASKVGDLSALSERAERQAEEAKSAIALFQGVRAQAEHAREMMAESIADAAARLDEQQARLELQQSRLDEQLGISQAVLTNTSAAEEKLELARRAQATLERTLTETIAVAQQAIAVIGAAHPGAPAEPVAAMPRAEPEAPARREVAAPDVPAAPEAPEEDPTPVQTITEEVISEMSVASGLHETQEPQAKPTPPPARSNSPKPMMDMFARLRAELER